MRRFSPRNLKILLNPPKNLIHDRFFRNYPKSHIVKFLIDRRLHRLVIVGGFKLMYWAWFKLLNRIKLQNEKIVVSRQQNYTGGPFLIIANHASKDDVAMHGAIWGHLGVKIHTLTNQGAFSTRYKFLAMMTHFVELVARYGEGRASILRMVKRLEMGDIILIYPGGAYPGGKYRNSGLVQEPFTGVARVAYEYWRRSPRGQKKRELLIQPMCSLGANIASPPVSGKRYFGRVNQKIIMKFGEPFTVNFSTAPDAEEFSRKSIEIQQHIAQIWGQKKLIPNYHRQRLQKRGRAGQGRAHTSDPDVKKTWKTK